MHRDNKLYSFFSNLFMNHHLTKVSLGLSRAFVGGFPEEFSSPIPARKTALKSLDLDLSNNRLRDNEILLIMRFFRQYTEIEELKLSLENCKLGDKSLDAIW